MTAPFPAIPSNARPFYVSDGFAWPASGLITSTPVHLYPGLFNDNISAGWVEGYFNQQVNIAILSASLTFTVLFPTYTNAGGIMDMDVALYDLLPGGPQFHSRCGFISPYGGARGLVCNATSAFGDAAHGRRNFGFDTPLLVAGQAGTEYHCGVGLDLEFNHGFGNCEVQVEYHIHGAHWAP